MSLPPAYFALMRHALSDARLDAYRAGPSESDLDLLARYAWNAALGAALYPPLQGIEVALRNTLDAAVVRTSGASWFDLPTILVEPWAQGKVVEAKQKLARQRKPIEPGRVVAELDFGFWTSLLNVAYEQGPNRPSTQVPLWPRLLPGAFPHAGSAVRGRYSLSARFNAIRDLRNRVSHHESIWRGRRLPNGGRVDLATQHAELLDALGWISPELRESIVLHDSFPAVYQQGMAPFRERLEQYCRERGYLA